MNKVILFLIVVLPVLASCSHSHRTWGTLASAHLYTETAITAWNEDTVLPYKFLLSKDKRFLYTIAERNKDGQPEKKWYEGVVRYGTDTLFMQFNKKRPPPDSLVHYLVVEMSGNYLIQPFNNSSKRVFMRIQRRPLY